MDPRTFDRWTVAIARPPTRRAALRLLAGGLLGGLLSPRLARAAQRPDRDGDGLYDDDEVGVYGTNPDLFDSDGDGVGDGEEVYLGTDPLTPDGGQTLTGGDGCAAGLTDCGDVCVDLLNDPFNCGACGNACGIGNVCNFGGCVVGTGEQGSAVACAPSLVNCGTACANLAFDPLHCGYCGNACPGGDGFAGVCSFGVCSLAAVPVPVDGGDVNAGCDDVPLPPGCYCVVNGRCVIADAGPIP
jgi:hypothetical protein